MADLQLPRFTQSLRTFSKVVDPTAHHGHHASVSLQQKRQGKNNITNAITWKQLNQLGQSLPDKLEKEVAGDIDSDAILDLFIACNELGEGASAATAAFLFETLIDSQQVGRHESETIRRVVGPFPQSSASQACKIVQQLVHLIPDQQMDKFRNLNKPLSQNQNNPIEFGKGIKFTFADLDQVDYTSNEGNTENDFQFDIGYKSPQQESTKIQQKDTTEEPIALQGLCNQYLKDKVKDGWKLEDICSVLLDILQSPRSNEDIQCELCDILGLDKLEFAMLLLEKRTDLVQSAKTIDMSRDCYQKNNANSRSDRKPVVASQITVQSAYEKQLAKVIQKEDRKLNRNTTHNPSNADNDFMEFDPEFLRQQRLVQPSRYFYTLRFAKSILSRSSAAASRRIKYPYVFDSMYEAQQTSAFLANVKVALPTNAKRSSDQLCESVMLPFSAPAPPMEWERKVPITALDEIAQMAFTGTKYLNRIQSIVYENAYNSNENLLICAPTGAGKTNVAMLTIIREIRQHIYSGVIKKDEFKIIYVAPMKALAAEVVRNFSSRLSPLGINVREFTGDMSLTKQELAATQMIVTTPEKWDVVTRKNTSDFVLVHKVNLIILDEVHLLYNDRGAVIESIVARTLRQVEATQRMIRIVGLSATLPNYEDVALFLRVNPHSGLYFFDNRFRPVPLTQHFIGIKSTNYIRQAEDMNTVCYDRVLKYLKDDKQVMVFVHARNATVRTARALHDIASNGNELSYFIPERDVDYGRSEKQVMKSRNKELRDLFLGGFGIHHAGMLRQDRNLVEKLFLNGHIRVLVCTATLAWGINLPAHAVIIKGTQVYDSGKGSFVDLDVLDVLQIFGRAGRPQFDNHGEGTIITTHDKLAHYLSVITRQRPIESEFEKGLLDNLNAEIALGTVTTVEEAVKWLSYTYLYIRMVRNPLAYGLSYNVQESDPGLDEYRRNLVIKAALTLDKLQMIRINKIDKFNIQLISVDIGRIASHFYIKYQTIETFMESIQPIMIDGDLLTMMSRSHEFQQLKVREDEMEELHCLLDGCPKEVKQGIENSDGKVNVLLQSFISRTFINSFSLTSDFNYVAQNSTRIARSLFEMAMCNGWPSLAEQLLNISKMIERRIWSYEHPLRQINAIPENILKKIEERKANVFRLKDMTASEIGHLIRHPAMGSKIKEYVDQLPSVSLTVTIQPVTHQILKISLSITPEFEWNDRIHGKIGEPWWVWVDCPKHNRMYHSEYFLLHKKQVLQKESQKIEFAIPLAHPLPNQYFVHVVSDRWLNCEATSAISFKHLILPEHYPPHTKLLELQPLPIMALNNEDYINLYNFTHFNPIQTQAFHTLYHTDHNVLLGAPTGSGKTVAAEIAIFRVFNNYPKTKAVYIAPLKALVRERVDDWKIRIQQRLKKNVIELTGDVTPDSRAISKADLIITTPEKWDGISRSWQTRSYVKAVSLIVIDEIHLLGDDRGPVLEVIVSRANYISAHTDIKVRVVGLSTALANARDLADWLNIDETGFFNFHPAVRPVPLEVHISGFPGKHYCPRMASMNKPAYTAIKTYSRDKPVLVFVSSRRQTRLTANDLVSFCINDELNKSWLHIADDELRNYLELVRDSNLRHSLEFGIGLHHAGLHEGDRKVVEELFVQQKIQILIATSTLAWGVNFPAHLVIVKGTEYYDGKTKRYVDFPVTDILQMMGRAGRPQFDDSGTAVILVHDVKKNFYLKFLYEPFPVESSLLQVLPQHLNAEIVSGTITSKQDAMDYITYTYFFRRLVVNPNYYQLNDTDVNAVNKYLSNIIEDALTELSNSYCIEIGDDRSVVPLTLGCIASYYYLHHSTLYSFSTNLGSNTTLEDLLLLITNATEYEELPVRHNEDMLNMELAKKVPIEVDSNSYDSPHVKTHLLLQAHFSRQELPVVDYRTDTKSVLDQAVRIIQALIDVAADGGWLVIVLNVINLLQMVIQGRWRRDSPLLTLPNIDMSVLQVLKANRSKQRVPILPELIEFYGNDRKAFDNIFTPVLNQRQTDELFSTIQQLPRINVGITIKGSFLPSYEDDSNESRIVKDGHDRNYSSQTVDWISVCSDREYTLQINLHRLMFKRQRDRDIGKAYAPRFPKAKDEGWLLILGDTEKRELLALKRVSYVSRKLTTMISFCTPEFEGRYIYTLYLLSDSYLGLDQQFDIKLDVQSSE
ncbi:uncharacterized protein TRIADDRAFT_25989 [Trichoplax adhaerens]|uniref:Activating signal cointegrator 1 complex subunit 3 n=1 Tax=Trichoplax adhaerens TaxID=10228 RepID=B3RYG0_TRIAD|nr:hypothetical protein TRIADDRAFT_25989 [Trichoplax adhaerens]EDV24592.1 hypothetical protein TRIADDRAFT_25989 [Trichoplax adhaerens]|eukprot:XP_002112482.1 hypothetical protein TRIADDRAFT_25989 [Trichoplax adhaerens]